MLVICDLFLHDRNDLTSMRMLHPEKKDFYPVASITIKISCHSLLSFLALTFFLCSCVYRR